MAKAAPPRVCPTTWCFALRLQMPDFSTAEEVRNAFRSIFNDTQQAIPGLEGKEVSHIFVDICTPRARLRNPLSKDGFPTLEYRPRPLAGHLYGLAKIMTGGRTPKSKPSLQHARTAAGNSSCKKGSRSDAAWKGGRHRKTPGATAISTCAAAVTTATGCNGSGSGRGGSATATAATACNGCCCCCCCCGGGGGRCRCCRIGGHGCQRGSNSASAATAAGCEARLREQQVSDGRWQVRAPARTRSRSRAHAHGPEGVSPMPAGTSASPLPSASLPPAAPLALPLMDSGI